MGSQSAGTVMAAPDPFSAMDPFFSFVVVGNGVGNGDRCANDSAPGFLDDEFGDFESAPSSSKVVVANGAAGDCSLDFFATPNAHQPSPIPPSPLFFASEGEADDDWGDFVDQNAFIGSAPSSQFFAPQTQNAASPLLRVNPQAETIASLAPKEATVATATIDPFQTLNIFKPPPPVALDEKRVNPGSFTPPKEHSPVFPEPSVNHTPWKPVIRSNNEPLPLSLFGEEESENEIAATLNNEPPPESHANPEKNSFAHTAGTENLSDIIVSLYASSPTLNSNGLRLRENQLCTLDESLLNGNLGLGIEDFANPVNSSRREIDASAVVNGVDHKENSWEPHYAESLCESVLKASDFSDVYVMLIKEGRLREALTCRAHIFALNRLSLFEFEKTSTMEPEDITSVAEKIEVMKAEVATQDQILQWQERRRSPASMSFEGLPNSLDLSIPVEDGSSFILKLKEMEHILGVSHSDPRAMEFRTRYLPPNSASLVTREVPVSVDYQARAFTAFSILACASAKDQRIFVGVWTSLASACGSVLHHALNIWKDAIALKLQQDFVRHPRGQEYLAAIGKFYAGTLILAAAVSLYKPWLVVAEEEGKMLEASLKQCKAACLEIKAALHLSLCHNKVAVSLLASTLIWEEIERMPKMAQDAAIQAIDFEATDKSRVFCGLSLLPVSAFGSIIPHVEWNGKHYLLPLANIWANYVSTQPPQLPDVKLGTISGY